MHMNYQFRLGSELMDMEDAQYLTKYAKGTHFIKGKGIISIQEEQSKALKIGRSVLMKKIKRMATLYAVFFMAG